MKTFKNDYKKPILKLIAFFLVVFIADLGVGSLLKKYYLKQQAGYDYQTKYSIENAHADVLIFGSSRAVNIFNTEIIQSRMNLSCYNVGRYGQPVFYHYAVLKSVLKRYHPKMVWLSFDAGNFSKGQEAYDRLSVLLPFYNSHPELRSIVQLKGHFEALKMLSHIYPYNSLLLSIITGNAAYAKTKYAEDNGFIPLKKVFTGPLQTFDYSVEKELDSIKIKVFRLFIEDCIHAGIELHIVCPPYMINAIGTDRSIIAAKSIAREYNIDFMDHSRDSFFVSRPGLFADFKHLNEKGVVQFTEGVINEIARNPTLAPTTAVGKEMANAGL